MTNHGKAAQELLDALHGELAEQLMKRIRAGEATAADFAVARAFLKDNGIEAVPTPDNGVGKLADQLPFPGDTTEES